MIKEAFEAYKKIGKSARIPAKALEILRKSGAKTKRNGVPYTINAIYAVMRDQYEDETIDRAIIQACKDHEKERKLVQSRLREEAKSIFV